MLTDEKKNYHVLNLLLNKGFNSRFLVVNMSLTELLPTVSQLTHEDKIRLIHFLLLAVAKEEGCNLEATQVNPEQNLLNQLASIDAVVLSPQVDSQAVTALSDLLRDANANA